MATLGVGSPAHRTYFDALYAHYGGGVLHGVTFEEMLSYEYDIMLPLLEAYYAPPRRYVFERNYSDTSGTWERWTSDIEDFYGLTGNERVNPQPAMCYLLSSVLLAMFEDAFFSAVAFKGGRRCCPILLLHFTLWNQTVGNDWQRQAAIWLLFIIEVQLQCQAFFCE